MDNRFSVHSPAPLQAAAKARVVVVQIGEFQLMPEGQPLSSAIEAIGNTPLVRLSRLTKGMDGHVLAKLDYLNPGLSKKDRIARQIIEDAESDGTLQPGQTVVELTSGNTGTGLAIVCAAKGYSFVAVMSKGNSKERARMMSALGAEVVLVDQLPQSEPGQVSGGDLELVEKEAHRIVEERQAFRADQFRLTGNFRAHYLHTGPEFIQQSGGAIDAFCDFVGTGGSFAGCAAAFKEHNPDIQCFVVEPDGAAVLASQPVTHPNHRIQGGGYSMAQLPQLQHAHIDGYLKVTDREAVYMARRLAREEGIFAGFSSGANLAAALHLLQGSFKGKTIAIILCDSGLKYLSTDLWA
jgi:cysteine synthase A